MRALSVKAYLRDFKNQQAVHDHLQSGGDFQITEITHAYCGKPINKSQMIDAGYTSVYIRYGADRKVVRIIL